MIEATLYILLELSPWLLLGALASAALHLLVPSSWLQRRLTGPSGVARAVALGVPLPLCSCGVIPAGIGLKRDGASTGSAIGFLVSTPQTGVDSVLVTASMLGWPFALYKLGAAAVTGLAAGLLADQVDRSPPRSPGSSGPDPVRPTPADAIAHAIDVLRSIWRWLVLGIAISAALTTFVPADALADTVLGSGAGSILAVLLLSIPLYVCATASVPIAASLVAAGLPTGAALVFLMAGPATNIATIGAVYRTFGIRVLSIYLGSVVLGSAGLGLLFDAAFAAPIASSGVHDHAGPVGIGSAVLLVGLLAWFAWEELRDRLTPRPAPATAAPIELQIDGMSCGGCARKLKGALGQVSGVQGAEVDHESGRAIVYGTAPLGLLQEAVRGAGFTLR
ncbi:MAG TPA: hypothetical protein ENK18_00355 [Deltaproteobacteria bacterium]|nr:hypothetical protein [Deltaproteobacteria bacterium]